MNQSIQFPEAPYYDAAKDAIRLDAIVNGWRVPCYFHASWFSGEVWTALRAEELAQAKLLLLEEAAEAAIEEEAMDVEGEIHLD
ncbi:DUF1488 family protein [Gallaecimonas sp. GXIMD4217]|uniref:DUF1488 family protein n=1 Tax=Gallaecimonas sp. GXIMD4217 TaxID=3131927 RepID=UPI00311AD452